MDFEYSKRLLREHNVQQSPTSSPKTPRRGSIGDRFIPARKETLRQIGFNSPTNKDPQFPKPAEKSDEIKSQSTACSRPYSCILKNELLGADYDTISEQQCNNSGSPVSRMGKMFRYQISQRNQRLCDNSPYSVSPLGSKSQKLLRTPKRAVRRICKTPYKVLDAPELEDDFYLNLVDWSSKNVVTVGLGTTVYLWMASSSQVVRLCDLSECRDNVTSVSWSDRGHHLAVGTQKGCVQIWDAAAEKKITTLEGHSGRVGTLAWNGPLLASGSRDRQVLVRDFRAPVSVLPKLFKEHRQEVCGLKWSLDGQNLASGSNDNRLCVWNMNSSPSPMQIYTQYSAAVKAIAWSPHQHGLLASGGGTADRCIYFVNTVTGQTLHHKDTGSQVCNLAWSQQSKELVSTHGYSQNEIVVWKYPTMDRITKLTGHTSRVCYMAMSPDGQSIVTGAGDETLRFWNVFSKTRPSKQSRSLLDLFSMIR